MSNGRAALAVLVEGGGDPCVTANQERAPPRRVVVVAVQASGPMGGGPCGLVLRCLRLCD